MRVKAMWCSAPTRDSLPASTSVTSTAITASPSTPLRRETNWAAQSGPPETVAAAAGYELAASGSAAGDVNGDGKDDLIIGAFGADPNGVQNAGQGYVVFGSTVGFAPSLNVSDLDGTNGFAIDGIAEEDYLSRVSAAGDVNGDGFDDVIIGAFAADPNGNAFAGTSYVVFGSPEAFPASFNPSGLKDRKSVV